MRMKRGQKQEGNAESWPSRNLGIRVMKREIEDERRKLTGEISNK